MEEKRYRDHKEQSGFGLEHGQDFRASQDGPPLVADPGGFSQESVVSGQWSVVASRLWVTEDGKCRNPRRRLLKPWARDIRGCPQTALSTKDAFWPPNPNEFDMARVTRNSRAAQGT